MDSIRKVLQENLTGNDLIKIAAKMDCSISKLKSYFSGTNNNTEKLNEVIWESLKYFADKYKGMICELKGDLTGVEKIDNIINSL